MTISLERGQLPAAAAEFQRAGEAITAEVNRLIDQLESMDWEASAAKSFAAAQQLWGSKTKVHESKLRSAGQALITADRAPSAADEAGAEASTKFTSQIQGALGSSS